MKCLGCDSTEGVQLEDSRTHYDLGPVTRYQRLMLDDPLNDERPNPNAPIPLCRDCAAEHHSQWDERWDEFYASRF